MGMNDNEINFQAAVYKVQTLVDGGIRVTLDLPESDIESMAKLVLCHKVGVVLEITATTLINKANKKEEKANAAKGQNKQSRWQTPQEQSSVGVIEAGSKSNL
jgi:hypothetical protein